jgi:hypothetical protein
VWVKRYCSKVAVHGDVVMYTAQTSCVDSLGPCDVEWEKSQFTEPTLAAVIVARIDPFLRPGSSRRFPRLRDPRPRSRARKHTVGGGMKRLLVAAAFASCCALASSASQAEPARQQPEFAPRKAYRECLNRTFAFLLIRGRDGRSPDTVADDAFSACRAEERALAALAEELMPIVKDRMKEFLVSGGHVPENLWWP